MKVNNPVDKFNYTEKGIKLRFFKIIQEEFPNKSKEWIWVEVERRNTNSQPINQLFYFDFKYK